MAFLLAYTLSNIGAHDGRYSHDLLKIKEDFDEAGVAIPFPQRDVHLFQQNER